ncbi:MAG: RNA polymerase sigma factor [Chloroflexi bacterium]|nr:RNA polymerase sigma factor [Chloroflexota bacterium]
MAPMAAEIFDARFGEARGRLIGLCSSFVGRVDADDAVQDVYLLARTRLHQLNDERTLDAWLNRIAVNVCFTYHRRRKRLAANVPEGAVDRARSRDLDLRDLIEALPPRDRTVLVLHYGHGYALHEVGQLLGLSHTNVRSIIARTRQRLFRAWKEAER